MNDDDPQLKQRLLHFRPSSPPAGLRERVLSTTVERPLWPWAVAAAASLVSALMFNLGVRHEVHRVDLGPDGTAAIIEELTAVLGGDEPARAEAESIAFESQLRADAAAMDTSGERR